MLIAAYGRRCPTLASGKKAMAKIKVVGVQKADNEEPPHFQMAYVDLERKKNDKGYFQTTKFDTEAHLRELEGKRRAGRRD
jgi:hypothetical protein